MGRRTIAVVAEVGGCRSIDVVDSSSVDLSVGSEGVEGLIVRSAKAVTRATWDKDEGGEGGRERPEDEPRRRANNQANGSQEGGDSGS